jgi:hypothetical protein
MSGPHRGGRTPGIAEAPFHQNERSAEAVRAQGLVVRLACALARVQERGDLTDQGGNDHGDDQ